MNEGKCRLCGETRKLSFEHVPPRAAFNRDKAFTFLAKEFFERTGSWPWDFSGIHGKQMQKGVGYYSLCEKCNNFTGGKYTKAYVDFAQQGFKFMLNLPRNYQKGSLDCKFTKIYPLRIIKQIFTMFISINNPRFTDAHPELRKFLLNEKARGLPTKNYALYIFLLENLSTKHIGVFAAGGSKGVRVASELLSLPYGFILEFNPKFNEPSPNIITWANQFDHNQCIDLSLELPIRESHTWVPLDYRSREKIMVDYFNNRIAQGQLFRKSPKNSTKP